jgi:hypothetical protein
MASRDSVRTITSANSALRLAHRPRNPHRAARPAGSRAARCLCLHSWCPAC